MEEQTKKCSKCNETKPLESFSKNKLTKDGYRNDCKQCEKQYREDNKEQIRAKKKIYREAHKEEIQKQNKRNRAKYTYKSDRSKVRQAKKMYEALTLITEAKKIKENPLMEYIYNKKNTRGWALAQEVLEEINKTCSTT